MILICYLFYFVYCCTDSTQLPSIEITQLQETQITQQLSIEITQLQETQQSSNEITQLHIPQQSSTQFQQTYTPLQFQQTQNNLQNTQITPTFYFRINNDIPGCAPVQNFNDGFAYGPCNNGQGVFYNNDSKYWVAINGTKSHCGKQIKVNYQGTTLILTVQDECPRCGNSKIDMSLEALIELTGSVDIACSINRPQPRVSWEFV